MGNSDVHRLAWVYTASLQALVAYFATTGLNGVVIDADGQNKLFYVRDKSDRAIARHFVQSVQHVRKLLDDNNCPNVPIYIVKGDGHSMVGFCFVLFCFVLFVFLLTNCAGSPRRFAPELPSSARALFD
jgi:hypothetical protein